MRTLPRPPLRYGKPLKIPTPEDPEITDEPSSGGILSTPLPPVLADSQLDEEEFVTRCVIRINTRIEGAYVFPAEKMGVFKAVGFPRRCGRFYRLEEYEGLLLDRPWTVSHQHPGWWGGAHPFAMLDYPSSTMGDFLLRRQPPLSKCSGTNAPSRPIPRSSPISSTISTDGRACPWRRSAR